MIRCFIIGDLLFCCCGCAEWIDWLHSAPNRLPKTTTTTTALVDISRPRAFCYIVVFSSLNILESAAARCVLRKWVCESLSICVFFFNFFLCLITLCPKIIVAPASFFVGAPLAPNKFPCAICIPYYLMRRRKANNIYVEELCSPRVVVVECCWCTSIVRSSFKIRGRPFLIDNLRARSW